MPLDITTESETVQMASPADLMPARKSDSAKSERAAPTAIADVITFIFALSINKTPFQNADIIHDAPTARNCDSCHTRRKRRSRMETPGRAALRRGRSLRRWLRLRLLRRRLRLALLRRRLCGRLVVGVLPAVLLARLGLALAPRAVLGDRLALGGPPLGTTLTSLLLRASRPLRETIALPGFASAARRTRHPTRRPCRTGP